VRQDSYWTPAAGREPNLFEPAASKMKRGVATPHEMSARRRRCRRSRTNTPRDLSPTREDLIGTVVWAVLLSFSVVVDGILSWQRGDTVLPRRPAPAGLLVTLVFVTLTLARWREPRHHLSRGQALLAGPLIWLLVRAGQTSDVLSQWANRVTDIEIGGVRKSEGGTGDIETIAAFSFGYAG
jgi:hypothetical protein